MKKTLTIAILGTIAATSVYADDLNSKIVSESITKYSNDAEKATNTDINSPIYAVKSISDIGRYSSKWCKISKRLGIN
ncbi:MAG: hypothetical protein AB8V10_06710 [Francisella endosymbiont of Hyalomma asiaticum]